MLTLHPEVGGGFGVGHLVGVLADILWSGDDDDEAPDGSFHLAHHVLAEVHGLTLLQPLALSVGVGDFALELSCLRLCHCHILQGSGDGSTWWQHKETVCFRILGQQSSCISDLIIYYKNSEFQHAKPFNL